MIKNSYILLYNSEDKLVCISETDTSHISESYKEYLEDIIQKI